MSTFKAILWFPGGLGILLWMSVFDGAWPLVFPALVLTPFVLVNLLVLFIAGLFKR